jgi:predicted nuclease of predicted toxin-antitoxin system
VITLRLLDTCVVSQYLAEADLLILATAIVHGRVLLSTDAALGDRARELGLGDAIEVIPLA